MLKIFPKRILLLGALALLLLVAIVARWISGWGLVTVHVTNVPLGTVIASIARQAGVRVETSLDLTKPVSLDVDHVPVAEALSSLSIRTESSWRLVYLAAPTKAELDNAVISLRGTGKVDDWTSYFYPQPPFADAAGGEAVDPRYLALSLEGTDKGLPPLLNEAAQKSGALILFPKDWAPAASSIPKANQVRKTIPSLVQSVHGKSAELFLLADRERREWQPRPDDSTTDLDQPPPMNPLWIEQRQLAQIAKLPPEKQAEAKQEQAERKTMFAEMKDLSPEERRAKMQAMMADPDRMEKMADRMLLRDAQMTTQQRINRAVNYIQRKAAAKGQ